MSRSHATLGGSGQVVLVETMARRVVMVRAVMVSGEEGHGSFFNAADRSIFVQMDEGGAAAGI